MDDALPCGGIFEHAKHITIQVVQKKHFYRFSELLENLQGMIVDYKQMTEKYDVSKEVR